MKKVIFFTLFVCCFQYTFSQNTNHTRVTLLSPQGGGTGEYIQNLRQTTSDNFGLSFVTNSIGRLHVAQDGNIGIGITNPEAKLHLSNSADGSGAFKYDFVNTQDFIGYRIGQGLMAGTNNATKVNLQLKVGNGSETRWVDGLSFNSDRTNFNVNVGIGTTNPTKGKLQVKGSFHVENSNGTQVFHVSAGKQLVFVGDSAWIQYQATLNNPNSPIQQNKFSMWVSKGVVSEDYAVAGINDWDDYVFNEDYDLPKLEKVAAFVKTNKHLPNIPSEAEVKKNGYSMHLFNRGILKTTEELTLYIIEQDEEIKALKEKTQQQDVQLKALQEKATQYEQLAAEVAALKVMLKENKK